MVRSVEAVLGQYARALLHISRGYALQEACQLLAASHGPACPDGADPWASRGSGAPDQAETVVARAPQWGAAVPVPVSWRLDREQVEPAHSTCIHVPLRCSVYGVHASQGVAWTDASVVVTALAGRE